MRIARSCRRGAAGVILLGIWAWMPLANFAEPAGAISSESSFAVDNLEVLDNGLAGRLSVLRVGSNRTNNNLLAVFARLKNRSSRALMLEAQTIYKDGSGNPLNGGSSSWISLTLKPHQEITYRSASLSEDAVDFVVRIRRPPN